jgi:beta-lactamase regulating signal transducer with metallopeptidase domain
MIPFAEWLSPELLRALGLALLHFLWQGAALAALAALAMGLAKSASTRYALGVAFLVAMAAAPVVTFVILQRTPSASAATTVVVNAREMIHAQPAPAARVKIARDPAPGSTQQTSYVLLVEVWFLGVLLFSMRTAGGVFLLERLRRQDATIACGKLLERCLDLQRRMGVQRAVRYCESIHLDAPAVIGWLRPAVLLPFAALAGLSEAQLETVIAHELAHIKRYDAFVNLFQVAAESVLFYHPALWWLSKRIRAERENCCDDVAIAICGSPLEYARALTLMEEWRAAPSLAMAANHGPLASRVRRLLGAPSGSGMRTAGLAAGVLCLSVAAAAGNAFFGVARTATAPEPASEQAQRQKDIAPAMVVRPEQSTDEERPSVPAKPAPAAKPSPALQRAPAPSPTPQDSPRSNAQPETHESYIDSMKAAGLDNLSVDQLIAMKVHGITAAYVRSIRAEGFATGVDALLAMKVHGITPEYIHEMRAEGLKLDADKLIAFKVHGVTSEYIRQMKELTLTAGADNLIAMKVHGVTPEYVKALQAAGLKFDADGVIGAKVQGLTPQFIEKARGHGFKDLTLQKLIELKHAGVLE